MAYTLMFYNLENLYDTADDPETNDDEFTPSGEKRWTIDRYYTKLDNLSEVVGAVASAQGGFPVVIGVSEVENMRVMRDLAARKRMQGAHYKCLHYESNDARGVDVGAFYRPDKFTLLGSEPVKLVLRSGREYIPAARWKFSLPSDPPPNACSTRPPSKKPLRARPTFWLKRWKSMKR